jgi:UDP-glucuronate decarboxylase
LTYLLLRFGIVASVGRYETTFKEKYGDRRFPFYRVTVCELSNFDILSWDGGVEQTLNASRIGDLVWALVKEIREVEASPYVYDFCVPGAENFLAGGAIFAHNTYGPRAAVNDGRVISNFITQALRGEELTVYGDGKQTRSFCYVDDMVEGIIRLMEHGDGAFTGPMNLGNPGEFTILELAERIIAMTGSRSGLTFKPLPSDDPTQRRPDITLARQHLGWEPRVPLEIGLARTVEYFRDVLRQA